jgi:hypothetical protein
MGGRGKGSKSEGKGVRRYMRKREGGKREREGTEWG